MTSDGAEGFPLATHVIETERGPIPSYRSVRAELNNITSLEHLQVRLEHLQVHQDNQANEEIYLSSNEDTQENEELYQSSSEDYHIEIRVQRATNMGEQHCPEIRTVPQAEAVAEDMARDTEGTEDNREVEMRKERAEIEEKWEKENMEKGVKGEKPKSGAVKTKIAKGIKKFAMGKHSRKTKKEESAQWYAYMGKKTAYGTEIPYLAYLRGFIYDAKTVKLTGINSRWCRWSRWCLAYWTMITWTILTATCVYMATDYAAQHLQRLRGQGHVA